MQVLLIAALLQGHEHSLNMQGAERRLLRSPEVLTPSQKLRDAEEDEAAAEETPLHHTSWGGRGRRGASGPSTLYAPDAAQPKRKRAQVRGLPSVCNAVCQLPSFNREYGVAVK